MIKIRSDNVIILALDAVNISRLMDHKPIHFQGAEINLPGVQFVIMAGTTLDDVREDLRSAGVLP